MLQLVTNYGGLINAQLGMGKYNTAKLLYADLKFLIKELTHDEIVTFVNQIGVTHESAGWLAKGWCENNGINNSVIEFETAGCIASPGETFHYRRSKKTWGNLVSIKNDEFAGERTKSGGEDALRMKFWLNENNPIRLKQTTRNELKIILGSKVVAEAMRSKKKEFIKEIGKHDAARVERITGLPIGDIWSAIKNGNKSLVEHLGRMPSSNREQMRRRGMFVSDAPHPQMDLFAA